MTSEVVVMNRAGVALAADSAVTVEMGASQKSPALGAEAV